MRPAISVIIPAHNEEQYIDACITSLLHQNASFRYEIIVVENNSTDTTPQRLKAYPAIRLIRQKRKGASAARNRGARAAKGDILVFLDADCIASPDHLSRIADFFATHPTVDVVGGPYIMHDGGRFVRWLTDQGDYYARYFQVTKLFFGYQAFAGGNVAFRSEIYKKTRGYNEHISVIEADDAEYARRLHKEGYITQFSSDVPVLSSLRRFQRSPIKDTVRRAWHILAHNLR